MYKFLITIELQPGTRDQILARAPEVQRLTRGEPGCLAYDFYQCTDYPDRLVFVEAFTSVQAHQWHCEQPYTQEFIRFHEAFHVSLTFEVIQHV
jgi:quinol monooxygenase YgiN